MIGNPDSQTPFWEMQIEPDNCAIVAEVMIIRQFGINIVQESANFLASLYGWYCTGGKGTALRDMGNLMTKYGIANHLRVGASQRELKEDLMRELIDGHGIIVGIRPPYARGMVELNPFANTGRIGQTQDTGAPMNHAVVLTGIDMTNPDAPKAIVNDPGHENGAREEWPLDHFLEACWSGGRFYVATDVPLPGHAQQEPPILGDIQKIYREWIDNRDQITGADASKMDLDALYADMRIMDSL